MCKKFIFLMSFVLVVALASNASADRFDWDAGGDGSSWNDTGNWAPDGTPTTADQTYMFSVPGATIDINGIDAFMSQGWAGHAANSVTVTIDNAGTLDCS